MAVIERPHRYCFSKNEIRYVFLLDDVESRPGLYLQCRIMYAGIQDADFTELIAFDGLKPDADSKVYLYIQSYLDSVLQFALPHLDAALTDAESQCARFYVEFREVEDANLDPEYENIEGNNERVVLKGGIERHKMSRNNFFINYRDVYLPFFTWQPQRRFIYTDEKFFLSFLNVDDDGEVVSGGGIMKIKKHLQDGTETTYIEALVSNRLFVHAYPLYNFPIDAADTNKVVWFEVTVYNTDGTTPIVNAYRVYVEYRPAYSAYTLFYMNSTGGAEALMVVGDTDISYARSTTEAEGGFSLSDWTDTTKASQRVLFPLLQRNYKGFISNNKTRTVAQKEALTELYASRNLYMLFDDRFVPVVVTSSAAALGRPDNVIDGAAIEWQLSENNEVFTPALLNFGAGVDAETYP
jgi:hypothetical protein